MYVTTLAQITANKGKQKAHNLLAIKSNRLHIAQQQQAGIRCSMKHVGTLKLPEDEAQKYSQALESYGLASSASFLRRCVHALIRHHEAKDILDMPISLASRPRPLPGAQTPQEAQWIRAFQEDIKRRQKPAGNPR